MSAMTIPAFIVLLGVLVAIHEFGHFMTGKLLGFKVLKFSIGFGPALIKRKWGETEYALSVIPLGGYVKFHGQELTEDEEAMREEEDHDPDAARRFANRPALQRMLTVVAGPTMNLVLGVVLYTFLALFPQQVLLPVIGEVTPGMPAEAAGLMPGDRIISINGNDIDSWFDITPTLIMSIEDTVKVTIERGSEVLDIELTPDRVLDEQSKSDRPIIGIMPAEKVEYRKIPWYRAPAEGVKQSYDVIVATFNTVYRLISGRASGYEVGGPLAIADMAGRTADAGLLPFLALMAALSLNLAVLNILPIPVLDGGLIFFLAIEAIRGKPVNLKVRETAQQIGLALLLLLIGFIMYIDISRVVVK